MMKLRVRTVSVLLHQFQATRRNSIDSLLTQYKGCEGGFTSIVSHTEGFKVSVSKITLH